MELILTEEKIEQLDNIFKDILYNHQGYKPNTCNMHDDCKLADIQSQLNKGKNANHCHDECCEECFGN